MSFRITVVLMAGVLAGCAGERGVGLGPVGYGGGAGLPQSTRTEVDMVDVERLPLYRFPGEASAAAASIAGGSNLRRADANLQVEVEGRTYAMRQIEIRGSNYVVAEGAAPVSALPRAIRTRTGCLVDPTPIRARNATVYTLDCS